MDASNFLSWFKNLFLRAVAHLIETAPVLLFMDAHHSHISLDLIRTAHDSNVILLCLPPNTTYLLQPLDVGAFGPLKTAWGSILRSYKLKTRGERWARKFRVKKLSQFPEASFTVDVIKDEMQALLHIR